MPKLDPRLTTIEVYLDMESRAKKIDPLDRHSPAGLIPLVTVSSARAAVSTRQSAGTNDVEESQLVDTPHSPNCF